ncbi:hypothetical protein MRB53_040945 [Persea americana]|nr:hypothetical protein MRB53_040945 [Persea americana]
MLDNHDQSQGSVASSLRDISQKSSSQGLGYKRSGSDISQDSGPGTNITSPSSQPQEPSREAVNPLEALAQAGELARASSARPETPRLEWPAGPHSASSTLISFGNGDFSYDAWIKEDSERYDQDFESNHEQSAEDESGPWTWWARPQEQHRRLVSRH